MIRIYQANPSMRISLLAAILVCLYQVPSRSESRSRADGKRFVASTSDFVGDGKTDNTRAIQSAIDSCSNAGGGVVEFSHGTFVTGPITLMSNVTLEIDSSATLLATPNVKAYYPAGADTSGPMPNSLQPLVTSNHASNITISGQGTIDGNGQPWWTAYKSGAISVRPRLMQFNHSQNITIDSVTLQNSPQFHVSLEYCWYVWVKNVTISAPSNSPNTDGIDPATCHFVYISHCRIDNGDDDIAVKSGRYDPTDPNAGCSNIWVTDCTILHGHGVSIGSETSGGVDSMQVDSCSFNGTQNGLRIKSYRGNGGNVRDITYSNITMQNVSNPIWLSGYYPTIPSSDTAQPVTSTTPYYHDIRIVNLTSVNSPTAGVIVGLPEDLMTHIVLENVSISSGTGLEVRNATVDTEATVLNVNSGAGFILQTGGVLTGVRSFESAEVPAEFDLMQNYPNPFNPTTTIEFTVAKKGTASLRVYNILGQEVTVLFSGDAQSGKMYRSVFDGGRFASGVYFSILESGGQRQIQKMVLMK